MHMAGQVAVLVCGGRFLCFVQVRFTMFRQSKGEKSETALMNMSILLYWSRCRPSFVFVQASCSSLIDTDSRSCARSCATLVILVLAASISSAHGLLLAARDRASATENRPGVAPTLAAAADLAKLPVLFRETKAGLPSLERGLDEEFGVVERDSVKVAEAIELGRLLVDSEEAALSRSNGGSDPLTAEAAESAAL